MQPMNLGSKMMGSWDGGVMTDERVGVAAGWIEDALEPQLLGSKVGLSAQVTIRVSRGVEGRREGGGLRD